MVNRYFAYIYIEKYREERSVPLFPLLSVALLFSFGEAIKLREDLISCLREGIYFFSQKKFTRTVPHLRVYNFLIFPRDFKLSVVFASDEEYLIDFKHFNILIVEVEFL